MNREEAIRKLEYSKKAYQMLIDEKVDSGKLVGKDIKGEWETDAPLDEVYKSMIDALGIAIKALEQQSCGDVISRQAALGCLTATKLKKFDFIFHAREEIKKLPPVTPQQKMGCEGCTYEKTGNNSTYPCSHCGRCYTDKYKAERNDKK